MYQRLGDLYSGQRIGSFESDGNGFKRRRGRHRGKLKELSNEELADKIAQKEAHITQIQQKLSQGKAGPGAEARIKHAQRRIVKLRTELASRKPAEALNGFGEFSGALSWFRALMGKKPRRRVTLKQISTQDLANMVAQNEAKLVQLQQKAPTLGPKAAKLIGALQAKTAKMRAELASRKSPEVMNGLGELNLKNPLTLGLLAAVAGLGVAFYRCRNRGARVFKRRR